jgi:hypothetical protein
LACKAYGVPLRVRPVEKDDLLHGSMRMVGSDFVKDIKP